MRWRWKKKSKFLCYYISNLRESQFHFPGFFIVMLDKDRWAVVGEVDDVVHAAAIGAGSLELHGEPELLA